MFQHIYIESQIRTHPFTQQILTNFPDASLVEIDNYKQFFNRPNQNFLAQRKNLKLILAKQEEHFLHRGSDRVRSFGDAHVISASMIRNCAYRCEYCFLSGMHESSNVVVYVNIEDFEHEITTLATELAPDPIFLVSSYLSDLPAFEYCIPLCRLWMNITKPLKNITLEIRTKSDGYQFLRNIGPQHNTVLTWSFSPQTVVRKYEHGTASLHTRILQASQALQDGWRVRLCFDPILYYDGWEHDYTQCVKQIFSRCAPTQIEMVSFGVFRMGNKYLRNMRKLRPGVDVLQNYVKSEHGLSSYSHTIIEEITTKFSALLSHYLPKEKYHFVHG